MCHGKVGTEVLLALHSALSFYLCAGSGTGSSESVSSLDTPAQGVDKVCPDVLMLNETS